MNDCALAFNGFFAGSPGLSLNILPSSWSVIIGFNGVVVGLTGAEAGVVGLSGPNGVVDVDVVGLTGPTAAGVAAGVGEDSEPEFNCLVILSITPVKLVIKVLDSLLLSNSLDIFIVEAHRFKYFLFCR